MLWRAPLKSETFSYFLYSTTLLPTEQFPFYDIGWSLQHEVAFYLLTATIVPLFGLYGVAAALAMSTLAFHTLEMPWYFSSLASYHGEFLAGVLAFLARPKLERLGGTVLLCVGAAIFWYVIAVADGRYWLPVPLFFLVLGFAVTKLSWSPLVAIGNASYSLYLLHPLVFVLVKSATIIGPPIWSEEPIRWIAIAAAIAISPLSWRYLEGSTIALGRVLDGLLAVVLDNGRLHGGRAISQVQIAQAEGGRD
jgi:peptidoglycan/LPS O-acetylase OafA/YrhL